MGRRDAPCIVKLGVVGDPIERLILIFLRKERVELVEIERAEGVDHIFDDLQLGSVSIEVGHFGCQGFVLVEW